MKVAAARTLAEIVIEPVPERIFPDPLDKTVGSGSAKPWPPPLA